MKRLALFAAVAALLAGPALAQRIIPPSYTASTLPGGPYLPLAGGTLTGNLLFTDNTLDIGANGATRPRTGYFGTSLISPILDSGAATDLLLKRNGTTGITLGAASLATFAGGIQAATVALGGATIGTDALAVTGTITASGTITAANSKLADQQLQLGGNGTGYIAISGNGTFQYGGGNVTSGAVAQVIQPQGNTGSTTNGPLFTIKGAGGGSSTSVGGELRLQGGLSSAAAGTGGVVTVYVAQSGAGATPVLAATFDANKVFTGASSVVASDDLQAGQTRTLIFNTRGRISSPSTTSIRFGDSTSTNTVDFTIGASNLLTLNGGLTTGGLATLPTATIGTTFTLTSPGTDAATTDASLCRITSTGAVVTGTGTLGICLGTSSARYKHAIQPLVDGLAEVLALKPSNFWYNKGQGDNGARLQYGFIAEEVVKVVPKLVSLDDERRPNSVDILGMVPILVRAIQEQNSQIEALTKRVAVLEGKLPISLPTYGPPPTNEVGWVPAGDGCNWRNGNVVTAAACISTAMIH